MALPTLTLMGLSRQLPAFARGSLEKSLIQAAFSRNFTITNNLACLTWNPLICMCNNPKGLENIEKIKLLAWFYVAPAPTQRFRRGYVGPLSLGRLACRSRVGIAEPAQV
jgi:hypothetical protein